MTFLVGRRISATVLSALLLGSAAPYVLPTQTAQHPNSSTNSANAATTTKKSKKSKSSADNGGTAGATTTTSASATSGPAAPSITKTSTTADTHATPNTRSSGAGKPPSPGMVWANTTTKVYHMQGSKYYGNTKEGKWMTEEDAKKMGYKRASN